MAMVNMVINMDIWYTMIKEYSWIYGQYMVHDGNVRNRHKAPIWGMLGIPPPMFDD